MKKIILAAILTLGLAGCAQFQAFEQKASDIWSTVTHYSISPKAVIVGGYSFDALEATATNYLTLKRCTGSNGPVCRSQAATKQIIPAVRSARAARDAAEQFLADHPGQLGNQGLYDAMVAAGKVLLGIFDKYGIKVQS